MRDMTREELRACLEEDYRRNVWNSGCVNILKSAFSRNPAMYRWRFIRAYRLSEYYTGLRRAFYLRQKNRLGLLLGYEFQTGCRIGPGLQLCHGGRIIINGDAVIGKNATIRGNCCIGNDGISEGSPVIGDDVEFGFGVSVLGDIRVADHTWIAAGAVVSRDVTEPWTVVGGVPARKISVVREDPPGSSADTGADRTKGGVK